MPDTWNRMIFVDAMNPIFTITLSRIGEKKNIVENVEYRLWKDPGNSKLILFELFKQMEDEKDILEDPHSTEHPEPAPLSSKSEEPQQDLWNMDQNMGSDDLNS